MAEELEALGAVGTAGLAAAAIEGVRHDAASGHGDAHAHGACANCHAPLSGPYCVQCGQSAHVHRSLLHMVEELLHGVFHFDTKTWRTIPMLIFRPGQLTRNYIQGQRMRYVSPLALFLFMVFLSFFVASFTNSSVDDQPMSAAAIREQIVEYTKQLNVAKEEVAKANAEVLAAGKNGGDPDDAREKLDNAQQEADEIEKDLKELNAKLLPSRPEPAKGRESGGQAGTGQADADQAKPANREGGDGTSGVAAKESDSGNAVVKAGPLRVDVGDAAQSVSVNGSKAADDGDVSVNRGDKETNVAHSRVPWVEKLASKLRKKTIMSGSSWFDLAVRHSLDNPDLALYKLKNTVYKYSFMLVPISLPFMWLLFFWKRDVKMFDHVVFVLYSLCFMSLLFVVAALTSMLRAGAGLAALALLVPPVHILAQLRGTYQLNWFSALWRTCVLLVVAFIVLLLFFLFVLMMSMH